MTVQFRSPIARTERYGAAVRRTVAAPEKDAVERFIDGLIYCVRSGQMVAGQHLLEEDLARRFGVSRGPVREGLKQLSVDGVVTLTRYRGAFIAVLDRDNARDLLDGLAPICELAAQLAAKNCGDGALQRELLAIATRLGQVEEPRNNAHYLEDRRRFYDVLIAMGGNSELARMIPFARTDLFRAQFERIQGKRQHRRHAAGYAKIAHAVASNDPGKAQAAVKRHFEATRRTLDALADEEFAGR